MKKIIISSFLALIAFGLSAQQEEQYTQFMYYKLGFNPAYAGAQETPSFAALVRQQWIGLEGAPQSQVISFNTPLSSTGIGLGANIYRHSIGATERLTAEAAYAYRFNLGVGGRLGIGLSTSVRLLKTDFDQTTATQPKEDDPSIPAGVQSKYVPNFGAGIYFSNQTFYFGISSPRLLENNIDLADDAGIISTEVRHFYLMGGILIDLGEHVQMQPQMMLKYLKGAPFDGDFNINFIFNERIYTGVSYRLGGSREKGIGEAGSFNLGMQLNDHIMFGVAYDATLSDLRTYASGTMEGVLRYNIGGRSKGNEILSPRFF